MRILKEDKNINEGNNKPDWAGLRLEDVVTLFSFYCVELRYFFLC